MEFIEWNAECITDILHRWQEEVKHEKYFECKNVRKKRKGPVGSERQMQPNSQEGKFVSATASPWISKCGHSMVNDRHCLFAADCDLWVSKLWAGYSTKEEKT